MCEAVSPPDPLEYSPGSFIQKSVHFLPFINSFNSCLFYAEATKSQFVSRLNSEIHLSHLVIFMILNSTSVYFQSYVW